MLNPTKLKTYLVLKRQAIACSKLTIETLEKILLTFNKFHALF